MVENVITNAFKGKSVLSLSGMKGEGKVEGVTVLRPLIDLSKQDVYDYAERYGVGYFKDTTPSWSTRGRVRNELLPVLNDVFGNGYEGNLEALGKGSDQVRDVVDGLIVHPFMRGESGKVLERLRNYLVLTPLLKPLSVANSPQTRLS